MRPLPPPVINSRPMRVRICIKRLAILARTKAPGFLEAVLAVGQRGARGQIYIESTAFSAIVLRHSTGGPD